MPGRREPVSIVAVFNDSAMLEACLAASIERRRADAPQTEYLPIDNREGAFSTAGAALNHGAAQARHDYVVFVHQDVALHSLVALEEAAGRLADDERIGVLGAVGPSSQARFLGKVRDRIFLLGESASSPIDVDTVDELLFMVPRRVLEREPLPDDPDLAWHAYAVEYGLRLRSQGLRVCVTDIPLTHNSLTGNLARLEEAYQKIAARHPDQMPVQTPQGVVGPGARNRERSALLSEHRWRYRWLLESLEVAKGRRAAGGAPCVLVDIRLDVDDLIARLPPEVTLLVLNADQERTFVEEQPGPLELPRGARAVQFSSAPPEGLVDAVTKAAPAHPILLTNLRRDDVRALTRGLDPQHERLLGYWTSLGYWMLVGVPPEALPDTWRETRARPLGGRGV